MLLYFTLGAITILIIKVNPPEGCQCIEDKVISFKNYRFMGLGESHRYSIGENQYSERQMK